jgi:hypothetical protein
MTPRPPTDSRCLRCGFAAAVLVPCLVAGLLSVAAWETQPEKQPAKQPKPDEKTELAEFLDDAKHYAIRIAKPDAVLKLRESPLLNFTNPERNQECGSVFVWLHEDRPAVMGQFFRHDSRAGRLKKHALHSLAGGPLEAKFNDRIAWTPEQPGIEWKSFPEAPPVAANARQRLFQMKQLSAQIKVSLTDPRDKDKPIALRRLDRPLFEYSAPKQGVTDGAIFSYVVATDPEAILLIEAFEEGKKTGFRYALARFHFWQLTAALNDKTVWDAEHDPSMVNNPFADPVTMKKGYNSFLPGRMGVKP